MQLVQRAELIDNKEQIISGKDQIIETLQEKLRLAIAQRFGKSSEKTDPNQRELFNEAELLAGMPEDSDDVEEPAEDDRPKGKKKKGRKGLNPDLPRERIEHRLSAEITRTAMAQWVIRLGELLQPLLKVLHPHQMQANYLQGDETRIQVHKEPGKNPTGDKQMWVLRSHGTGCGPPGATEPNTSVITFHYDPTRAGAVVTRLLEDYTGQYFQCDGYSAYSKPCKDKKLIQLGCWDHARRMFKDAEKALPEKRKSNAPPKCVVALSMINKLYSIECKIKDLPVDEKYEQRQKLSVPALAKLHDWLQRNVNKIPKDGKTGAAIHYTLNQWGKLQSYTMSGELHISNVLAENAIRPFVIGRKNWMFADTPKGAHASACFYSLIETAKANGVEPYGYLKHVIGNIAYAETVEDLEALLPWNMP